MVRSQSSRSSGGKWNGRDVRQNDPVIQPVNVQTPSVSIPITDIPTPTGIAITITQTKTTTTPTPEFCPTPMPGTSMCSGQPVKTVVYGTLTMTPNTLSVNRSPMSENVIVYAGHECMMDVDCFVQFVQFLFDVRHAPPAGIQPNPLVESYGVQPMQLEYFSPSGGARR